MAGDLKSIVQKDFSGGGNWASSFLDLLPNQLAETFNLAYTVHGEVVTRPGLQLTSSLPDTTSKVVAIDVLNKTDGTVKGVVIQQATPNKFFHTIDNITWTQIVGAFTNSWPIPHIVPLGDQLALLNGVEIVKLYDGTTIVPITAGAGQTVPPGGVNGAFHLSSLWLWGTGATETALDGPSSLRMSDPNNPNSWPNANQVFIGKGDGTVATGISSLTLAEAGISPTSSLVLFKNFSTYQASGVMGPADFQIQRAKTNLGCIAPKSVQFCTGFGVIRLTHQGFGLFDGVGDIIISEEVRPLIFGGIGVYGQLFTGINFNPLPGYPPAYEAWSVQSINPPLYICGIPMTDCGGNVATRIFVYDLVRKVWSIWQFLYDLTSFSQSHISILATERRLFGGSRNSGQIFELRSDAKTDSGFPIPWAFVTRAYHGGDPLQRVYWRRFNGIVQTIQGSTQELHADFYFAGYNRAIKTTFTSGDISNLLVAGSIDLMTKAPLCVLNMWGNGNMRIIDLEFQVSPEPLTGIQFHAAGSSAPPLPTPCAGGGGGGGGGGGNICPTLQACNPCPGCPTPIVDNQPGCCPCTSGGASAGCNYVFIIACGCAAPQSLCAYFIAPAYVPGTTNCWTSIDFQSRLPAAYQIGPCPCFTAWNLQCSGIYPGRCCTCGTAGTSCCPPVFSSDCAAVCSSCPSSC